MTRLRKTLLLAGLLLVAAAIAGVAEPHFARTATPSSTTISVNGDATVNGVPDRASFDFGVTTNATTASAALSRNGSQAQAIVSALENAGVDAADIQTSEVSLWPQTSHDGTEVTGYQASNSVDVKAPLSKAGNLVDTAVAAGADSVDGPNLDTSDQSSLYADALKQAIANAKSKAQTIAAAEGLTLGAVVKVEEGSSDSTPVPYLDEAAPAATTPIEAGTQQIEATVTVVFSAN